MRSVVLHCCIYRVKAFNACALTVSVHFPTFSFSAQIMNKPIEEVSQLADNSREGVEKKTVYKN